MKCNFHPYNLAPKILAHGSSGEHIATQKAALADWQLMAVQ
jgi:hypothetical protein